MGASMLRQYGHLEQGLWNKAVDLLAHSGRWPRFSDIDETLKSLREKAEGEKTVAALPKPANLHKANLAKINAIVAHIGKQGSFKGLLTEPSAEIINYAKKLFPDCDIEFIKRNYCDISAQKSFDDICDARASCGECPFAGHRQFLRIDKRGGNTYMCADAEICGGRAFEN